MYNVNESDGNSDVVDDNGDESDEDEGWLDDVEYASDHENDELNEYLAKARGYIDETARFGNTKRNAAGEIVDDDSDGDYSVGNDYEDDHGLNWSLADGDEDELRKEITELENEKDVAMKKGQQSEKWEGEFCPRTQAKIEVNMDITRRLSTNGVGGMVLRSWKVVTLMCTSSSKPKRKAAEQENTTSRRRRIKYEGLQKAKEKSETEVEAKLQAAAEAIRREEEVEMWQTETNAGSPSVRQNNVGKGPYVGKSPMRTRKDARMSKSTSNSGVRTSFDAEMWKSNYGNINIEMQVATADFVVINFSFRQPLKNRKSKGLMSTQESRND
ncbi:hypothetical protein ACFE04_010635 [Oxalis oulophora]